MLQKHLMLSNFVTYYDTWFGAFWQYLACVGIFCIYIYVYIYIFMYIETYSVLGTNLDVSKPDLTILCGNTYAQALLPDITSLLEQAGWALKQGS